MSSIADYVNQVITDEVKTECAKVLAEMCDPYVPYDTGALANNITVDAEGVTYNQPYATKVYEGTGIRFNQEKHPLATAQWDQAMLQSQGDEFDKRIEDVINRHSEGMRFK